MSAGRFELSKYEANSGAIHQMKIQPESALATFGGTANTAPAAAVDSEFAAEVNRGASAYGLRPRKINVAFEADVPDGYRPYTTLSIAILTEDLFTSVSTGDVVVYQGSSGKVTSKSRESTIPGADAITTVAAPPV